MQQINLYTAEFRPRQQWLTLNHGALLALAILAFGVLIAFGQAWQGRRLQTQIAELESQLQTAQAALQTDSARLAQQVPSATLTTELARSQAEETAKQQLLTALETGVAIDRQTYSPILVSLARHPLDGLWLTAIEITGTDVNLSGKTRSADLVPSYVDTIVKDADFGPHSYQSLSMQATEGNLLSFELRGHRDNSSGAQR